MEDKPLQDLDTDDTMHATKINVNSFKVWN